MARKFDGVDDFISHATPTIDNGSDDITVTMWNHQLSADLASAEGAFGFVENGTTRLFSHAPFTDSVLYWDRVDLTNGRISTSYAAFDDKYSHVGLISKLSATTEKAIWLDGVEQATSAVIQASGINNTGLRIGGVDQTATDHFHIGRVAEFAIFKTVLTDNQLAALGRGVPVFVVTSVRPYLYVPIWGNDDPEAEYINGWDMALTSAPTKIAHPPVEHLENYL